MRKLVICISIFLLIGCKTEGKQTDNELKTRVGAIIVCDLLDEYKYNSAKFPIAPIEVIETVYNLNADGQPRDTLHYTYHLKNSLLQFVEVKEGTLNYVNTFHYNAQGYVATMESKDVNGEQLRKFIIEYDEQGLLKRYTDYLGNEIDEIYTYQLSPSGDVLAGQSNYGGYDKYIFGTYRDSLLRIQEGSYTGQNINLYGGTRIFDKDNKLVERYADSKNLEKKYIYTYDNHNNLIENRPNEAQAQNITLDELGNKIESNPVHRQSYKYTYDEKGNWTERLAYIDDVLYSKAVRVIKYRN